MLVKDCRNIVSYGLPILEVSAEEAHLLYGLVGGGGDDVALMARQVFGEPLQDLGVGLRGGLVVTCRRETRIAPHKNQEKA